MTSRPLSREEVTKAITAAPNMRDKMLIMVMACLGLRISEAANLKVLHLFNRDLTVKDTAAIPVKKKTYPNATRECYLPAILRHSLDAYYRTTDWLSPDGPLFPSRQGNRQAISVRQAARELRKAFRAAGLTNNVSPHSLRKYFAVHCYTALDENLMLTQRALGHYSAVSTIHYLKIDKPRIERACQSVLTAEDFNRHLLTTFGVDEPAPVAPEPSPYAVGFEQEGS